MRKSLSCCIVAGLGLCAILAAIPAPSDFKLKNLSGSISIHFQDVRIPAEASFFDVRSQAVTRLNFEGKTYEMYTLCTFNFKEANSLRVLNRPVEFSYHGGRWIRGRYVHKFVSNDRAIKGLECKKLYREVGDQVWHSVSDRLQEFEATVADVQGTFGKSSDGRERMIIHLGSNNEAFHRTDLRQLVRHGYPREEPSTH